MHRATRSHEHASGHEGAHESPNRSARVQRRAALCGSVSLEPPAPSARWLVTAPALARAPAPAGGTTSSAKGARDGAVGSGAGSPDAALALARRGRRSPLPFRAELEARFGCSLAPVEAYFGDEAQQACELVGARAFCVGNVVVFSQDAPDLDVVAHEVAHVIQQGGHERAVSAPGAGLQATTPDNAEEREADSAARSATASSSPGEAQRAFGKRDPTGTVLARLPDAVTFGERVPGLMPVADIVKEGYDGSGGASIAPADRRGWGGDSWERRWHVYDGDDRLVYDKTYTVPDPTLHIPADVIASAEAGGRAKPWSVWIEVTKTTAWFGGDEPANFPYDYETFHVYDTWSELTADPAARLSTAPGAAKAPKPQPLDKRSVDGARSVTDYGSTVAMNEGWLREVYDQSAKALTTTAEDLVQKGVPQNDVARWAVESRNELKAQIRAQGNPILKHVFEARNLNKYGNKLGPAYEALRKKGLTDREIIEGSGRANLKVNRWAGRLKIAGRIFLALDVALAGVRVALAPEGQRVQVAFEELARIGGAIALGVAGAKAGAAAGAAIGALFGGAGAVPGAIIGGFIGAIGGGLLGGWLGKSFVRKLFELLPPSDTGFEGGFTEE